MAQRRRGLPFLSLLTDACETLGIELPPPCETTLVGPGPPGASSRGGPDFESLGAFTSREDLAVIAPRPPPLPRRRGAPRGRGSSGEAPAALTAGARRPKPRSDERQPRDASPAVVVGRALERARRADALYRRALASFARGDVEEAYADVLLARVFSPDSALYRRAARLFQAELKETPRRAGIRRPTRA